MNRKTKVVFKDYIEIDNHKYYVDGKKVVLEPSKKEIRLALWLSKKLSTEIVVLPRIKQPEGIKTSDYLIYGEKWDLKEIFSNRNDAAYNRIRRYKDQASNFIIDISNSKLTMKATKDQVVDLYQHKNYRWLNKIIIKKNNELEFVFRK